MDSAASLGVKSRRDMKTSSANVPAYRPLYRQIKNLITDALVSGEWRPGESIPSEIELANRFSVSQGTVRKAISELAEENLLVRHQGKGTFVASHSDERSRFPYLRITPDQGAFEKLTANLIEFRKLKLDAASARKLGLAGGSSAFLIRRTVSLPDHPVIYEEIRLPAGPYKGLTRDVIDRHQCMLYSMYESEFQVRILYVEEQVRAQPGKGEVADYLDVAAQTPLLVIDRVAYTYAEKAVELRRSYCNTEEHYYRNRIV